MESRVCCSCCHCRMRAAGLETAWLQAKAPNRCYSVYQTLDFSAEGSDFPGLSPRQNKQINHSCFATLFCCPPQLPALPTASTDCQLEDSEVRSPGEGPASSVPGWCELDGWRKMFKTLGKTVFLWAAFPGGSKPLLFSAATAGYSGSGVHIWDWGRGPFLSGSICFSS